MPDDSWTIDGQEQRQIKQGNDYVKGYRVKFTTGNGVSDYIDIPESQYSAANVSAQIRQVVAQHDLIAKGSTGTVAAS